MEESSSVRRNWLAVTFLFGNFLYGLGFSAGSQTTAVNKSSLFQSMHSVDTWMPMVWGSLLVVSVVLAVVKWKHKAESRGVGATLGVLSWLYATIIYAQTGYWLVFFTVGLLYLSFWVYFYWKYVFLTKQAPVA